MNVTGKTRIYRKEWDDGGVSYSRRIASQKYENGKKGDWIGVYEQVQMPKGTNLPDKCTIEVTKGFEAVYENRNGEPMRKLVVLEYTTDNQERPPVDNTAQQMQARGFDEIDSDVPF